MLPIRGIEDAYKAYDSGDYTTAFRLFLKIAQQGDAVKRLSFSQK